MFNTAMDTACLEPGGDCPYEVPASKTYLIYGAGADERPRIVVTSAGRGLVRQSGLMARAAAITAGAIRLERTFGLYGIFLDEDQGMVTIGGLVHPPETRPDHGAGGRPDSGASGAWLVMESDGEWMVLVRPGVERAGDVAADLAGRMRGRFSVQKILRGNLVAAMNFTLPGWPLEVAAPHVFSPA